jgi:iron complex transport system substrate-binding protein
MAEDRIVEIDFRPVRRRAIVGSLVALGLGTAPWRKPRAADTPRVVSVGGALTEIVCALGAQRWLVGTDTTSIVPPAVLTLPKVGYQRTLSAEGVLSLRPTLVLATADAGPPAALEQLQSAGVRVMRADGDHSFDALTRNVATIADALALPAEGKALDARLRGEWSSTLAAIERSTRADRKRPKVIFILSHAATNVQVAGRGTAADAMIRYAGGVNALTADGGFNGYRPLAAEAVVAAAPDFILTTREGVEALGGIDALLARPGLALTPAGRARRVIAPEALLLLGFGPRLPQAVSELAQALGTAG